LGIYWSSCLLEKLKLKEKPMKTDRFTKVLLFMIAALLLLNLLYGHFNLKEANSVNGNEEIGRYQVAAWAAQSGVYTHHSGYFIIDTTTGKVFDSKAEIHTSKE
jgi:hypothetical protein